MIQTFFVHQGGIAWFISTRGGLQYCHPNSREVPYLHFSCPLLIVIRGSLPLLPPPHNATGHTAVLSASQAHQSL